MSAARMPTDWASGRAAVAPLRCRHGSWMGHQPSDQMVVQHAIRRADRILDESIYLSLLNVNLR